MPPEVDAAVRHSSLRVERRGRRADVVLDSPQDRNTHNGLRWRALAALGTWLPTVADVVVLRATGPSFSAGLDLRALTPEGAPGGPRLDDLTSGSAEEIAETIAGYQEAFTPWAGDGMVTIAAVRGHAIGAGFQLALACDLRVAAEDASFALREVQLGLVPDLGGTHPLIHLLGYSRALELGATGRAMGAQEALDLGLVLRVVPPEDLVAATDELAEALLAVPATALLAVKTLLRGGLTRTPTEQRSAERAAQAVLLRGLSRE
jgi:enoyl-CoA hydratase/carnithine racemase